MSDMAYTKLFSSIVHSTIWREDSDVRVVWVTMLALASKRGVVSASLPGLADAARVPLEKCQEALRKLESPDLYSRSKVAEGRRIREVEGGWELINHRYYRELRDDDQARIDAAERQRRHRNRPVTECHAESRDVMPVTPPDTTPAPSPAPVKRTPAAPAWSNRAVDIWRCYFGPGSGNPGAIGRSLKPLVAANGETATLRGLVCYCERSTHPSPSAADFVNHFADYLPGGIRYSSPVVRTPLPGCPRIDDLVGDDQGVVEGNDLSTGGEPDALPLNLSETSGAEKWDLAMEGIRRRVNRHTVSTWYEPCSAIGIDPGGVLWVSVPNERWISWMEASTHSGSVASACKEAGVTEIRWVVGGGKR